MIALSLCSMFSKYCLGCIALGSQGHCTIIEHTCFRRELLADLMVTSVSRPSHPASTAFSKDIRVFSGASCRMRINREQQLAAAVSACRGLSLSSAVSKSIFHITLIYVESHSGFKLFYRPKSFTTACKKSFTLMNSNC